MGGMVSHAVPATSAKSFYELVANDIRGHPVRFDQFRQKVVCVVNIASKCGLTPTNYKELNELHAEYHDKGLQIIAFPCNQFMGQEPGTNEEIQCRIDKTFAPQFMIMEKVNVNGEETHPVYAFLKHKSGVTKIDWNFAKFTVDKNEAVKYYRPTVTPKELSAALQSMLSGIHQVD
jgi:glutathione peroxidase-family protein